MFQKTSRPNLHYNIISMLNDSDILASERYVLVSVFWQSDGLKEKIMFAFYLCFLTLIRRYRWQNIGAKFRDPVISLKFFL